MKRITKKLRPSNSNGVFHNSREVVTSLATMVNLCIDKINELVEEVETLKLNQRESGK